MRLSGLLVAFICLVASAAQAQSIREQRVHFSAGRSGTTLTGRIRGYEVVDYVLGASAGQRMI
ncbi:MAG: hypothetical protein KDJ41_20145, partial [Hyphomicrobiaceae bacterium]|nr:hypothetical protein [Hyphomicrobiaceae bacterium]